MEVLPTDSTNKATINPTSTDLVLGMDTEDEAAVTVTIPKTVGVNRADVYLLADTTSSMGSTLNAVKTGAKQILDAPYAGIDIAFGVGDYRDLPHTNPPFRHEVAITRTKSQVQAGIAEWLPQGGSDRAESQLYALNALAGGPGGERVGWRSDSKRIVVWFGDAPGHDPICKAISGLDEDITEASVRARLVEQGITVIAISVSGNGLDQDPIRVSADYARVCDVGGEPGQATRIADETGGKHVTGINPSEIVSTIIELIDAAIRDIGEVTLVPSEAIAPFITSITPASFSNLEGELEHELAFTVNCKGVIPCINTDAVHAGALNAVADGAMIASQSVQITVPACNPLRLTRFVLVNAETNEDIRVIEEGDILDLNELPDGLNVRVEAGDGVKSVTFAMTPNNNPHFKGEENERPYSLFGDIGDDYNEGTFSIGAHSLSASPFSELRATGDEGETLSVNFQVVNGAV